MITETQFEHFQKKYQKLIYAIGHRISGDPAISSLEDNTQDLWIAVMEAIAGFEKQGDGQNGKLEDFIESEAFNKYLKTCLWTKKNHKGKWITKKKGLTSGTVDVFDNPEILGLTETKVANPDVQVIIEDFAAKLSPVELAILQEILSTPDLIKPNGKANVSQIAKNLNLPMHKVRAMIQDMSEKFKNEF